MKRIFVSMVLGSTVLCLPTIASACGTPTEQWYRDVSDIIFDATATCNPDEETCRFKVRSVYKNALNLEVERRPVDIDYYSWHDEFYENNPDTIVLACGVPNFKPDQTEIRGRFYANLNREKQELVIRRYVTSEDRRD